MNTRYKNTEYLRTENHFSDRKNSYKPWNYCSMCQHSKHIKDYVYKCELKDAFVRIDTTDFVMNCDCFIGKEKKNNEHYESRICKVHGAE